MTYRVTVAKELSYADASEAFQRRPLREKVQCSCRRYGVITDDRICKHGGAILYRCCMASELSVRFLDAGGDTVFHMDNFRELARRSFGPAPDRAGLAPEEAFRPVDGVVPAKGPPNLVVPMPMTLYRGMGYPGEAVLDDLERVRAANRAEEVAVQKNIAQMVKGQGKKSDAQRSIPRDQVVGQDGVVVPKSRVLGAGIAGSSSLRSVTGQPREPSSVPAAGAPGASSTGPSESAPAPSSISVGRSKSSSGKGKNRVVTIQEDVDRRDGFLKGEYEYDGKEFQLPRIFADYEVGAENAVNFIPGGGGDVLTMMNAVTTQKMAVYLISHTGTHEQITMTGYTFDVGEIADALTGAAARGVDVTLIMDRIHVLKGTTIAMVEKLSALRHAGANVWLCSGKTTGSGIQHSKTLLAGRVCIIGSTNWTQSSRLNQEISVLLSLNERGYLFQQSMINVQKSLARKMTDADEQVGREHRAERVEQRRARSASRTLPRHGFAERVRQARQFSIMNDRRLKAGSPRASEEEPEDV